MFKYKKMLKIKQKQKTPQKSFKINFIMKLHQPLQRGIISNL